MKTPFIFQIKNVICKNQICSSYERRNLRLRRTFGLIMVLLHFSRSI